MITEERISTFINSFDTGNTPFLNELEQYARETNVPVIRPQMQSFLKLLLSMKQPERILEVGTAIGFSALFMSEYGRPDCQITTIENYEKRIPIARENFRKAGKEESITLLEGDATEILKTLQEPYDMIFMDIQMPEMDGYKATQAIRNLTDKDKACIPIIAMTANAFAEDKRKTMEAGMNAHLSKPLNVPELMDTIRKFCDGK